MLNYLLFTYIVLFVILGLYENRLKYRIFNLLISFDQFLYVIITLGHGHPDETISSACYRYEQTGNPIAKVMRPFVDWLFLPIETEHCYKSYMSEINRTQSF